MSEQRQMQEIVRQTFNDVAAGYDGPALRFFPRSAEQIVRILRLRGDEQVLDVACGTGHVSFALSQNLTTGRVRAVDLSPAMLDQARKKASALNVSNIEFVEGDMQDLDFPAETFDVAVCAFGIFFVPDMEAQLAHIASRVRSGGRILITSFVEDYFQPLRDRLFGRLAAYGVADPPHAWKAVATADGCRRLFEQAGLKDIQVSEKNVGYYLSGADEWWDIVWNAGFRRFVAGLSKEDRERFKKEHLAEIEDLGTKEGIRLDTGVLFTVGSKA